MARNQYLYNPIKSQSSEVEISDLRAVAEIVGRAGDQIFDQSLDCKKNDESTSRCGCRVVQSCTNRRRTIMINKNLKVEAGYCVDRIVLGLCPKRGQRLRMLWIRLSVERCSGVLRPGGGDNGDAAGKAGRRMQTDPKHKRDIDRLIKKVKL